MGQLAAGGNFLGNLMMGIYQGQQAQQHQENLMRAEEMKNELIKLQVEHAKAQTKQLEIKDAAEARKQAIFQQIFPSMAAGAAPSEPQQLSGPEMPAAGGPVFGPGFENQQPQGAGGNVAGMMARLQSMDPMQLAALKESGYDVVPGMNANRMEREFSWRQQQEDLKNWMKSQEIVLVPQQAPDGSVRQVPQFKNPAAAEVFAKKVQELNGGSPMGGVIPQGGSAPVPPMPTPPRLGGGAPSSVPTPVMREWVDEATGKTMQQPVNPHNQEPMGHPTVKEAAKKVTPEEAGKITNAIISQNLGKELTSKIINPKTGKPDPWVISQIGMDVGIGREIRSKFSEAVDTKIRAMTGAAMNKEELPFYENMYLPSVRDLTSPGLVEDKLKRFDAWNRIYLENADPSGLARKRSEGKKLSPEMAQQYFTAAGGDKAKARKLAKNDGWEF